MAHWRWVWTTKRDTWVAACTEPANVKPFKEPPRRVRIIGHFKVPYNLRDEGGLQESLKPVVDALKRKHHGGISNKTGKAYGDQLKWRSGLYLDRGYIIDDSPDMVEYGLHTQETVPGKQYGGLTLTLEVLEW